MLLLLTVLLLVGAIICCVFAKKSDNKTKIEISKFDDYTNREYTKSNVLVLILFTVSFLLAFAFVVCAIETFTLSVNVFTSSTLDQKITMYEEENSKIEESISTVVEGYMNFEQETFTDLKTDDVNALFSLVSIYPELKSDTLVQQQMQIYMDNSTKIKELKEQRINLAKDRWLLYFGN